MNTQPDHPRPAARELVLASAGSGKTYRISSRIIELLAGGESPRSILASTFTRKAAGEILERVLLRLARASTLEHEAIELSRHALPKDTAPDNNCHTMPATASDSPGSGDCAFWTSVLRRTIADLHRLNIGTLDALFFRAVKSFSHDLRLPSDWGIADAPTADRIRAGALEVVLERVDTRQLLELLRSLHSGSVKRSVHDALAREIDGILLVHRAIEPSAPGWNALSRRFRDRPAGFAQRAANVLTGLQDVEAPRTRAGKPSARWETALTKMTDAVRAENWQALAAQGPGKALLNSEDPADAAYSGIRFTRELLAAVRDALDLARDEIGRELASRADAMRRLAETYEDAFESGLISARSLRFEDVTHRLLSGDPLGGRGDLFFRLDGVLRHVLLDEFQDTSLLQWEALVPLLDALNGPESGSSATVVVADPKQSIYGWRGAAPGVIDALGDRYGLPRVSMSKSWRSSQIVLDAVNGVFDGLEELPAFDGESDVRETVRRWCGAFEHHMAAGEIPGHARLVSGPPLEGRGNRQPELSRFAAREIAALYKLAPGRTIGVLTRTNAEVARLIFELSRLNVPASEEGGTTLLDSPAVVSVLALLRLVDHPGDGLARYHVATTPVGAAVRLIDWRHPSQAYIVAREWRRRLQGDGYGRALSDLEVQLRTASSHRDRVRLRRLVELAYAWEAAYPEAGLRADDFVQLVESERAESPAEDPVRIMTVHRSKGLEFDMVVLPQLYGTLHGRAEPGPLGYRPEEIGAVTHAFPYVSNDLMPLFKDIHELYAAQRQQRSHRLRDALGTLYVGMTRARHALHMIIPSDSDGRANRAVSPARILRETLSADAANAPLAEGVVVYESGEPDWMARVSRPLPVQSRIAPPTPPKIALRRDTRRTRGLERVTPSAPGDHETIDVERVLGIGRNERSFVTGTLVHAWLETLEWSEDGLAPEPKLRTIASQIVPEWSEDDVQSALLWLRDRIGAPEVDRALSRQSWPDGAQVEREIPFIVRERDTIVEGIMDRLVLILGPERKISEAVVLDYKTDRFSEEADGTSGRLEHYRGQIAAYRRAVQAQYGLVPERVSGKLVFLEDGSVIEVLET